MRKSSGPFPSPGIRARRFEESLFPGRGERSAPSMTALQTLPAESRKTMSRRARREETKGWLRARKRPRTRAAMDSEAPTLHRARGPMGMEKASSRTSSPSSSRALRRRPLARSSPSDPTSRGRANVRAWARAAFPDGGLPPPGLYGKSSMARGPPGLRKLCFPALRLRQARGAGRGRPELRG